MKHLTVKEKHALAAEVRDAVNRAMSPIEGRYVDGVRSGMGCPICVSKALAVGIADVLAGLVAILEPDDAHAFLGFLADAIRLKRAKWDAELATEGDKSPAVH